MSTALRLRLYTGGDDLSDVPAGWTIRQAFTARLLPRLQRLRRADGSIEKYDRAVRHWESYWRDAGTPEPSLINIDPETLTACVDWLVSSPLNKIATHAAANQQLMYLHAILDRVQDIYLSLRRPVPKGDPLPEEESGEGGVEVPLDLLDLWYRRCRVASQSTDARLPAPLVWRSLLVLYVTCGCRRSEAARMPRTAWHREPRFPRLPGFRTVCDSPHGWLAFETPKTRRRKGGLPLVIPVHQVLAEHLAEMDRLSPHRERMFPLDKSETAWRNQFRRIQAGVTRQQAIAAGYPEGVSYYTFQDLRVTANMQYLEQADREIGEHILGHAPRGVNARHYDRVSRRAADAVARMVWPAVFSSASSATDGTGMEHG